MRVVVVGASGNLGTSVLTALRDDLRPDFQGADAVVCLAWLIQPSRDLETLRATNVDGSRRVFDAASEAGVPALLAADPVRELLAGVGARQS